MRDNGTMAFQIQFTHTPSSCDVHSKKSQQLTSTLPKGTGQQSCTVKPKGRALLDEGSLTLKQGILPQQASPDYSDDDDIYKVELLARWGKNIFFLRWDIDGSTSWEPRRNIPDKEMLYNFKSNYDGFNEGVNVLHMRETERDKRKYLLHFKG
ncbi:hypothetical protein VFPPC_06208 [Pochonia chlamydosporia 170]|uniref:Chromo domain-containing protein n=1 Tax=Pochonia chlamydosporia 170 TaxID=1380566 RepID=A0A179FIB8_METCM|nr:hypothetical protein VFPPC_06208 [Pochonia chlamydosporia 170]OAQ65030.1 hypothetical protein VFPPC_06208 [Pochonia chlamydosporia 170]